MNNNFFGQLKLTEVARLFISLYQYREVQIQNVEGVFIENKSAKFPLIRISKQEFANTEEYEKDARILKEVLSEYEKISGLNDAKVLCLYFGGVIEEDNDPIYSIILDENDVRNNELLNDNYPLVVNNLSLLNINKVIENLNSQFSQKASQSNGGNTNKNINLNEKNIVNLFASRESIKNIKFGLYFPLFFIFVSLYAFFMIGNTVSSGFESAFGYYQPFVFHLYQYYRIFTGIFFNQSIITALIIAYFLFRYLPFVEMKIGTKKTMVSYLIGLLFVVLTMLFLPSNGLFLGSYSLMAILTGCYIGVAILPSERPMLKFNLIRGIFLFTITALFLFANEVDYISSIIGFLAAFATVIALKDKNSKANGKYVGGIIVCALLIVGAYFIPYGSLNRDTSIENKYFEYLNLANPEQASKEKKTLKDYYDSIGSVDYND